MIVTANGLFHPCRLAKELLTTGQNGKDTILLIRGRLFRDCALKRSGEVVEPYHFRNQGRSATVTEYTKVSREHKNIV